MKKIIILGLMAIFFVGCCGVHSNTKEQVLRPISFVEDGGWNEPTGTVPLVEISSKGLGFMPTAEVVQKAEKMASEPDSSEALELLSLESGFRLEAKDHIERCEAALFQIEEPQLREMAEDAFIAANSFLIRLLKVFEPQFNLGGFKDLNHLRFELSERLDKLSLKILD